MALVEDRKEGISDSHNYDEYVIEGDTKIVSNYNFSHLALIDDVEFPINNILLEYLDSIEPITQVYKMTDLEYNRYCMRPDLFSYDRYGDMSYEFIILALNEMIGPKDFNVKKVKYIIPSVLPTVLGYIKSAEKQGLDLNRASYTDGAF